MGCIGRIDDFQLFDRVGQPLCMQHVGDVFCPPDDQRLSKSLPLIGDGCAQHAWIVAFGKDHRRLCRPRPRIKTTQHVRRGVHTGFERRLVGVHVDDGAPRYTRRHACFGNGRRNAVDQAGIERRRYNIIPAKGQLFAISDGNFLWHVFPRQLRKGMGAGDLHLVIDGTGMDIEGAAKQIRKA